MLIIDKTGQHLYQIVTIYVQFVICLFSLDCTWYSRTLLYITYLIKCPQHACRTSPLPLLLLSPSLCPPNKTQLHAQRRLISSSNNQDNKDKLPLICYCCSNELLNEKLSEIIGKVYVLKNDSQEPLLRLISPRQDTTINMQITDYAVL